ncbi:MAG: DoxX family protein [Saprospiraceae bacterium]
MSKRNKIIYWIATIWLSLGMVSTGIVQILRLPEETQFVIDLGFPIYILPLLGVWKILGVLVILIPGYLLLKEWAYAGFFFTMTGALYAHIYSGSSLNEIFPAILLLVLTLLSWYFRPESRKIIPSNK